MNVFIGSSWEALRYAEDVCAVLEELGQDLNLTVSLWNDQGLFRPGEFILEGMEKIGRTHHAAVLLATADDQTTKRGTADWTPRDNIVFEAGHFMTRATTPGLPRTTAGQPSYWSSWQTHWDRTRASRPTSSSESRRTHSPSRQGPTQSTCWALAAG